jgi:peptidoglycan/xylan/chitin deacetylase (PgdA/CDA1 family)
MAPREMGSSEIVFLMYHELELPGRPLVQSAPGYVRYILSDTAFRTQIKWLKENGWRGLSVSEALLYPSEKAVAITFDDGCETDLIAATPLLHDAGFHATFYATAGFLDKPGYMSAAQLRELHDVGFEIGCHSMTHAYLNDLSPQELQVEIVNAKEKLQDITGSKIEHFSCPGGRYDQRTLAMAKQAGYCSVANSHIHANSSLTSPYELGRVAIMRDTSVASLARICTGEDLWKMRLRDSLRGSVRKAMGNALYDVARRALLRHT